VDLVGAKRATVVSGAILTGSKPVRPDVFLHAYNVAAEKPSCRVAASIVSPRLRNPAVNSSAFALIALVYGRAPRRRVPRQRSTSFRNASISLSMSTSLPRKVPQLAVYVRTGPGEALRRMGNPAGCPHAHSHNHDFFV
jgi:hypothetical protein